MTLYLSFWAKAYKFYTPSVSHETRFRERSKHDTKTTRKSSMLRNYSAFSIFINRKRPVLNLIFALFTRSFYLLTNPRTHTRVRGYYIICFSINHLRSSALCSHCVQPFIQLLCACSSVRCARMILLFLLNLHKSLRGTKQRYSRKYVLSNCLIRIYFF